MVHFSPERNPESGFEGQSLKEQIQQAQDLGQVCFLNTDSGLCLRVSPQQSALGAVRAALGYEGSIEGITFSLEPDEDAQTYTSSSRINGEGGLRAEIVADFYQKNPVEQFAQFVDFREAVSAQLGFIDVTEWGDLVSGMPLPISLRAQHRILAPMLEMGELGEVCEIVEDKLKELGWSRGEIATAFNPEVRNVRSARFRFQELTGFSLSSISNTDQLRDALVALDNDPYDLAEPNPFAKVERSEALLCFIKGQPLQGADMDAIKLIMGPLWRELVDDDMAAARSEAARRGWAPMTFPRFTFDQRD